MAIYDTLAFVIDYTNVDSSSATHVTFQNTDGTFTTYNGTGFGPGGGGTISSIVQITSGGDTIKTITGNLGTLTDTVNTLTSFDTLRAQLDWIDDSDPAKPDFEDLSDPISGSSTQAVFDNGDGTFTIINGTNFPDDTIFGLPENMTVTSIDHSNDAMGTSIIKTVDYSSDPLDHYEIEGIFAPNTVTFVLGLSGDNVIDTTGSGVVSGDVIFTELGEGDDTFIGGIGDDLVYLEEGVDTASGGDGADVAIYNASFTGETLNGVSGNFSSITDSHGDVDTLSNFETIYGSQFDDTLTGDANENNLQGNGGDDLLTGNAGADIFTYSFFELPEPLDIGDDIITDFDPTNGQDFLSFQFFNTSNGHTHDVNDFSDLGIASANGGADTVITIPGVAGSITLQGVTTAQFTADDVGFDGFPPPGYLACFPAGTLMLTADGEKPIETLTTNDMMVTLDGSLKPMGFLGVQTVKPHPVTGHEDRNLPILLKAGAFGPGAPAKDLVTSWWHGILLQGSWIEQWFGEPRVIIPAGRLLNGTTISQLKTDETLTYYNVVMSDHDVIFAHGAAVETFRPLNGNQKDLENYKDFAAFNLPQDELEALYEPFCRVLEQDGDGQFIGKRLEQLFGSQVTAEIVKQNISINDTKYVA